MIDAVAEGKVPSAKIIATLQLKPTLLPHLQEDWDTFWLLSGSRSIAGFGGCGPIPMSEVVAYFQLKAVRDQQERERTLQLLLIMDREFLQIQLEDARRQQKKGK